jgi:hypothetical protein
MHHTQAVLVLQLLLEELVTERLGVPPVHSPSARVRCILFF